jgi:cell wall-associated NlpC family hydrolase
VRAPLALALTAALLLVGCGTAPPSRPPPVSHVSADEASDVAIHALGLVGTRYRYGGNTPAGGFDCSGLINYVFRNSRAQLLPPRTVLQLSQWGAPVPADALRTGDLVIFDPSSSPTHAGIYVGEGRFVHAPSTGGDVRLDRLDSKYWSRQKVSFRRP